MQPTKAGLTLDGIVLLRGSPLRFRVVKSKSSWVLLTRDVGDAEPEEPFRKLFQPSFFCDLCSFISTGEGKLVSRVSSLSPHVTSKFN